MIKGYGPHRLVATKHIERKGKPNITKYCCQACGETLDKVSSTWGEDRVEYGMCYNDPNIEPDPLSVSVWELLKTGFGGI